VLTQAQTGKLRDYPGPGWISAPRGPAIRQLVETGGVQPSLFEERNLAEIRSPEYPDERLVACFNPVLAEERRRKRKPLPEADIALKVGKVLNRFNPPFSPRIVSRSRRGPRIRGVRKATPAGPLTG
jgi:hypothetical protein